jgi:shikimate kinase
LLRITIFNYSNKLLSQLIFIVGPGGAGKSTTGKLLSERLNYQFVDVDLVFCERIRQIPDHVREFGYKSYCETNSALVDQLLGEYRTQTVMSMPSGFLVHEDSPELVAKHLAVLSQNGLSVLLLPSKNLAETTEIIVERQLSRGFSDMTEAREKEVILRRFPRYLQHGDVQIFSHQAPAEIVELMIQALKANGLPKMT